MHNLLRVLVIVSGAALTNSCWFDKDDDKPSSSGQTVPVIGPANFFSTMTQMRVEVAYEPGAEPYVGQFRSGREYWSLLKDNLTAIFAGQPVAPAITVPFTITEMQKIDDTGKATWTPDEIVALAKKYQKGVTSATDVTFFIIFLDGLYMKDGVASQTTLGVSLTGTTIVAMFKPVVKAAGEGQLPVVSQYVEQSTLIHEAGHALGLVNNGVPMTTAHQDEEHGAHCTNPDCVMFWQNEGSKDLLTFIQKFLVTQSIVMFGNECLSDTRAF
jgi:hypothetical protein